MWFFFLVCLIPQLVESSGTFSEKQNSNLHCKLALTDAISEIELEPAKHYYNDATGNTYIYNGASVTVKCADSKKTFTNRIVTDLKIGETDEYKLFKVAIVRCYYSSILEPDIFTDTTQFCAEGCAAPQFPEANYDISPSPQTGSNDAPYKEGKEYTVECNKGYVRAWKDDGLTTFKCENGQLTKKQSELMTCAPGCKDLSEDIIPYVTALAIDPKESTEKNMVWPGAPYPWGATLQFTCYNSASRTVEDGDDGKKNIYCYKEKDDDGNFKEDQDCGSGCTSKLGYWSHEVAYCKWEGGDDTVKNLLG